MRTRRAAAAPVSITLESEFAEPAACLGTSIVWTATVNNAPPGHTYDYQFSAALQGTNQVVRDFDLPNSFTWVPYTVEGTYVVSVVVRDITQQPYLIFPRVLAQVCSSALGHHSRRFNRESDVASPGGLVQRRAVHGRSLPAGPLPAERCAGLHDDQCRAVFLQQRELPGCGDAALHSVPDALGGIRQQFREQRARSSVYHRTTSGGLSPAADQGPRSPKPT